MADLAMAGVVAAGDRAVQPGERFPQVVAGVRQPQVQVVVGGQRVEQFDLGARAAGCARTATAAAAGPSATPAAAQGFWRAGRAAGRRRRGRPARATASGCQCRSSSRSPAIIVQPVDEQLRALRGHTTANRPARRRATAYRRPCRSSFSSPGSKWPRWVARVCAPGCVEAVVDHLEQRPRPWRRVTTDRRPRCR